MNMGKAENEITANQEYIKKEIEKKRKKKIMYQDVINEAKRTFSSDPEEIISDIRPAERPFIDSMIKTSENGVPANVFVYVPYGIVIWLKNGDKIIYQLGEKNRT